MPLNKSAAPEVIWDARGSDGLNMQHGRRKPSYYRSAVMWPQDLHKIK